MGLSLRGMAAALAAFGVALNGLFQQWEGVPSTNNGTERIIGRLKGRSHSVRGYKSQAGIESLFHLSTAVA